MRITGGLTITGGMRISGANSTIFTTSPSDWFDFSPGTDVSLNMNTLTTDVSGDGEAAFLVADYSLFSKLIGMFGDPAPNSSHGGVFNVQWSDGSTTLSSKAFVALWEGTGGPVPLDPGQYGIFIEIEDNSETAISGTWVFPATFSLLQQYF